MTLPPDGLRLDSVSFGYGPTPVVSDISLAVPSGQLLALLGPSGCGKTTLLKLLGGYLSPTVGRVFLRGKDVTLLPPEARNAGMVFQNYALFPHLTAGQNVAFGLEMRRVSKPERQERVDAILARVGLTAAERDRKPSALSGGQQQRVALARALVIDPDVLLLDEPLANLDPHLRAQFRTELRTVQRRAGVTAVLVTHDREEALAVADLLVVMVDGQLLQYGTPEEVYHRPRTPFVASFVGMANLLNGELFGLRGRVMIRPEWCELNPMWECRWKWSGHVAEQTFHGADHLVAVKCDNGLSLTVRTRLTVENGQPVVLGIPSDRVWPIPDDDPPGVTVSAV